MQAKRTLRLRAARQNLRGAHRRRATAVQPRSRSRANSHRSIWNPRAGPDLYIAHRAAKRIAAPVVQAAHTPDVCLQQKLKSPEGRVGVTFCVLQFLPEAFQPEGCYACNEGGDCGSGVEPVRIAFRLKNARFLKKHLQSGMFLWYALR